jgi:HEAT repeat protein
MGKTKTAQLGGSPTNSNPLNGEDLQKLVSDIKTASGQHKPRPENLMRTEYTFKLRDTDNKEAVERIIKELRELPPEMTSIPLLIKRMHPSQSPPIIRAAAVKFVQIGPDVFPELFKLADNPDGIVRDAIKYALFDNPYVNRTPGFRQAIGAELVNVMENEDLSGSCRAWAIMLIGKIAYSPAFQKLHQHAGDPNLGPQAEAALDSIKKKSRLEHKKEISI